MTKDSVYLVNKSLFSNPELNRIERKEPAFFCMWDKHGVVVTRKNNTEMRIVTLRFTGLTYAAETDTDKGQLVEYGLFCDMQDSAREYHARRWYDSAQQQFRNAAPSGPEFGHWKLIHEGAVLLPVYEQDGLLSETGGDDAEFLSPEEFWKRHIK